MNNLLFDFAVDKATKTVFITREFEAGLSLMWDAFTKPEILDQWWAPKPLTSKTKVMNFEVGGRRFYAMVWPEGQEYWGVEKYTLINPKTNIKWLASFTDKDENINAELPTVAWELNFSEKDTSLADRQRITTVSISVYFDSLEDLEKIIEMGFKEGFSITINELANLLNALNK
jgi:uncharacterized protein YndB with AHSA1/START domain